MKGKTKVSNDEMVRKELTRLQKDIKFDMNFALNQGQLFIQSYEGSNEDLKKALKARLKEDVQKIYQKHDPKFEYQAFGGKQETKDIAKILTIVQDEKLKQDLSIIQRAYEKSLEDIEKCIDDDVIDALISGSRNKLMRQIRTIIPVIVYGVLMALSFVAAMACVLVGVPFVVGGGSAGLIGGVFTGSYITGLWSMLSLSPAQIEYEHSDRMSFDELGKFSDAIIENTLKSIEDLDKNLKVVEVDKADVKAVEVDKDNPDSKEVQGAIKRVGDVVSHSAAEGRLVVVLTEAEQLRVQAMVGKMLDGVKLTVGAIEAQTNPNLGRS